MINYGPTWAEIDLNAVRRNFCAVRDFLSPATKILAVVKANAYGHGAEEIAKVLQNCGVDYLGVASLDEAIALKKAGINKSILILTPLLKDQFDESLEFGFTQSVCCPSLIEEINKKAKNKNKILKVHLKIDTGMGIDTDTTIDALCNPL